MTCETDGQPEAIRLPAEQEEEVLSRCMRVVDFVSDMATDMIMHVVQNPPSPEAKDILLEGPEEVAIRAFEKALHNIIRAGARPQGPMH